MADDNAEVAGCLVGIIWLPLLVTGSSIYHGYVLTKLWLWFVVPTFHLPMLSLPAAIGLSLVISYLAKEGRSDNKEGESIWAMMIRHTASAIAVPTLSLLIGWIVNHWM